MIDFSTIANHLKAHGINAGRIQSFQIPNSTKVLEAAMQYFIGESFEWIPEYNQVAEWLTDTKGRGLLLYGTNGTGKSVLIQKAIPAILLKYCNRVVSVYDYRDLNTKTSEIMSRKILSIDDFGCESEGVEYGNRRWVLPELMDLAEKQGLFVLLSTNFKGEDISNKYGIRTLERIISTTKRIEFNRDDSFRR